MMPSRSATSCRTCNKSLLSTGFLSTLSHWTPAMEKCSPELVTLIFELACAEDFGETARRFGLVSKSFRVLSEPIELRSIAISGIKQLRGAISRIDNAQIAPASDEEGVPNIPVRYLFISELTKEHAILADSMFENRCRGQRGTFWMSEEGEKALQFYFEHSDEFWRLAGELVRKTGPGLRTLFLLSSSNWFSWRDSDDLEHVNPQLFDFMTIPGREWRRKYGRKLDRPKVFGALSGVQLPNLVSLTMNHNAAFELRCFGDDGSLFKSPTLPALRQLRIVSGVYTDEIRSDHLKHPHPLLACLLSKYSNVEQLVLCSNNMESVGDVLRAIFGPEWRGMLSGGKLPGNLRSVVLQQGIEPDFYCGAHVRYWDNVRNFEIEVASLNVPGLEAKDPSDMFPKDGEREYELLLSEWKDQCLAGLS